MSRIWLSVHYPFKKRYKSTLPSGSVSRTWLLQTALQNFKLEYQLRAHESLKRWVWWSTTYVQWHALAVALAELCVQTDSHLVEKAWPVVDEAYSALGERVADTKKGQLWRPITSLYRQANIQTAETFARLNIHNNGPPLALDAISTQDHRYPSFQTDFGQNNCFDNRICPCSDVFDPFSAPITQPNVDMSGMDAMSFDHTGVSMIGQLGQVGMDEDWMHSTDWANWNGFVVESQAVTAHGGGQLGMW